MRLELLRALHVLARLRADQLLGPRVLLPLERQHEQLQRRVVELVRLLVLALIVVLDGLLHRIDGAAEEVGVAHAVFMYAVSDVEIACPVLFAVRSGGVELEEEEVRTGREQNGGR